MDEKRGFGRTLFLVSGTVFVLWLLWWSFAQHFFGDWGVSGSFGDTFGALNALFAGLAFGAIIITLYYQRQDLLLQSKELKLTRQEMELTRQEMEAQNHTLRLQRFENTFFEIITLHHQIVSTLELYQPGGEDRFGRSALQGLHEALKGMVLGHPPPVWRALEQRATNSTFRAVRAWNHTLKILPKFSSLSIALVLALSASASTFRH